MKTNKIKKIQKQFPLATIMIYLLIAIITYSIVSSNTSMKTNSINLTLSNPEYSLSSLAKMGQNIEVEITLLGDPIIAELIFNDRIQIESEQIIIMNDTLNSSYSYRFKAISDGEIELITLTTGVTDIVLKMRIYGISDFALNSLFFQSLVTIIIILFEILLAKHSYSDKLTDMQIMNNKIKLTRNNTKKAVKLSEPSLIHYYQNLISSYRTLPLLPIILFYFLTFLDPLKLNNRVKIYYSNSSAIEYSFEADIWNQSRYLTFHLFLLLAFILPIIFFNEIRNLGKENSFHQKTYPVNHYKRKFIKLISSSIIVFLPTFLLFTYNLHVFSKRNPELFNLRAYFLATIFVFLGLIIFLAVVFSISETTESSFFFFLITPAIIWLLILDDRGYENQLLAIIGGLRYFDDQRNADNYSNLNQIFVIRLLLFLFTFGFYVFFQKENIKKFLKFNSIDNFKHK